MMKSFLMTLPVLIILIITGGCAAKGSPQSGELQKGTAKPASEHETFTVEDKNFRVKTTISRLAFAKGEEIDLYSTIEYIGENESITIWSGDPYYHHTIYKGDQCINGEITHDVLKKTTLKKGEIVTIPFSKNGGFDEKDPDAEYLKQYFSEKELKLPEGEYVFAAKTAFTLDQEQKDRVILKNEFTVKVN